MKPPPSTRWLRRLATVQIILGCVGLALTVTLALLFETASGNALDAAASAIDSTGKELAQVHQAVDQRRVLLDRHASELDQLGKQFLASRDPTTASLQGASQNLHDISQTVASVDKTLRNIGGHLDIAVPSSINMHLTIGWAHPLSGVKDEFDSLANKATGVRSTMAQAEQALSQASQTANAVFDIVGKGLPDVEKTFADLREHDLTNLGENLEATRGSLVAFSADLRSLKLVVLCGTALLIVLSLLFICNGLSFRFLASVARALDAEEGPARKHSANDSDNREEKIAPAVIHSVAKF